MSGRRKAAEPPSPARVGPLDTIADLKLELGRLYRAARRGDVPAADASKLAAVLALLLRAIEGSDIERRLATLEGGSKGAEEA